tara:strand:- start:29 stop:334 length:306 start_codon:yes stop_codon:yes gene_type:complete
MTTEAMRFLKDITGGDLTLGDAIKAIRLCDEISQGEFAKTLKVSQSYLSDLEKNRKEVSPRKAAELAVLLGQSKKQFIRLAVQDALARQGLHYQVDINDVA